MEYKKSILDILNYLKQIGLDRRTIEKELGYKEYYLDQAISKGGNKMLLNKLKEYSARKRVMEDRMEGVIQVKDSDLGFLAGLPMLCKVYLATHEGKLTIGELEIPCAVLEDGTRIISYSAVFKAFGRTKRGSQGDASRVHNMPAFLNSNNLQPFVGEDLRGVLKKIDFIDKNGKENQGFNALIYLLYKPVISI